MHAARIVLLGAGRVATQIARALTADPSGRRLTQIYSPQGRSASRLVAQLAGGVQAVSSLDELDKTADCYLFAVPDQVIAPLAQALAEHGVGSEVDALWVHVSGATPLERLTLYHHEAAVLYPLQTFSAERQQDFRQIPLYLEGSTPTAQRAVESLARQLSSAIFWATTEQRQVLHLAAVVACNFSNYLIGAAERLLEQQGLPPKALLPLLDEMNDKLHQMPALEAQTGPAQRGDEETMQCHRAYLYTHGASDLAELYATLSAAIQQAHRREKDAVK